MKRKFEYMLLAAAAIATVSCDKDANMSESVEYRTIKVCPDAQKVKGAFTDPAKDIIYLYTFDETGNMAGISAPSEIKEGIYTYNIPTVTDHMIFSTLKNNAGITEIGPEEGSLLKFHLNQSFQEDLAVAHARSTEIPETGNMSIHLERIISKVSATLLLKDINRNPLDISKYILSAEIILLPGNNTYVFGQDGTGRYVPDSYSSYGIYGKSPAPESYEYIIGKEVSVPPCPENELTTLQLNINNPDGTQTVMTKKLNYSMAAGKHYKLSISVVLDETGFGFRIEDIINEELEIELN